MKEAYLKRAFSAPNIWIVEAGYLAKLVKLPACDIRRAATFMNQIKHSTQCNLAK